MSNQSRDAYNPRVKLSRIAVAAALLLVTALPAAAQHAAFRIKGRVVSERGELLADADVRLEAFYGYAGGTFAGPRKLSAKTNAKGEWNVGALQPGVWLFEVKAPNYLPETVVLPIRILTTVSVGTSGMTLIWDLILKPALAPDMAEGELLTQAPAAAHDGKSEPVRTALQRLPEDPDGDYPSAAGRIAMVAGDLSLAKTLFISALERDPSSYRAAIGDLATITIR